MPAGEIENVSSITHPSSRTKQRLACRWRSRSRPAEEDEELYVVVAEPELVIVLEVWRTSCQPVLVVVEESIKWKEEIYKTCKACTRVRMAKKATADTSASRG